MKKNIAKAVIAVVMAGAVVTGQITGVVSLPLPMGQEQQVQAAQSQIQTIVVSENHTAVIKEDGSLWTWDSNYNGERGDGTTEDKYTPVKIMDNVVSIYATYSYESNHRDDRMLAIKKDGSLWT